MKKRTILALTLGLTSSVVFASNAADWLNTSLTFDTSALVKLGADNTTIYTSYGTPDWHSSKIMLNQYNPVKLAIGDEKLTYFRIIGTGTNNKPDKFTIFTNKGAGGCNLAGLGAGNYNIKLSAALVKKEVAYDQYRITCTVNPAA